LKEETSGKRPALPCLAWSILTADRLLQHIVSLVLLQQLDDLTDAIFAAQPAEPQAAK